MEMLGQLWLPILVAAGFVFVASFVSWMVLPFHKQEWGQVKDEDAFFADLQARGIGPGKYMFPGWEGQSCKDPVFMARWNAGPHGTVQIWPRPPHMARNLALVFLFYVVVGVFVGYLAGIVLPPGTEYLKVFQVTGVAAILAYVFGQVPDAIWFQKSLGSFLLVVVDGVVYGLLTAGTFAWLWPAA